MNHWHTGNKKLERGDTISNRDRAVPPSAGTLLRLWIHLLSLTAHMQFSTSSNKPVNVHSHPGQGLKGGGITAAALFKQQNGHKGSCRALPGAAGTARIRIRLAPAPRPPSPAGKRPFPGARGEHRADTEKSMRIFILLFLSCSTT